MTIFCKGEDYAACKNCIACVVDYGCNHVRCRAKGVEITSIAYEDNRYCDRWVSRTWMQSDPK